MENISVNNKTDVIKNRFSDTEADIIDLSAGLSRSNPEIVDLIAEGGEDFYNYLQFLNLIRVSNMIVLSPKHHYYFESYDLADVRVLVNIVRLNQIKNLGSFLDTVYNVLPPKADFIGCFTESKVRNGNIFPFYPPVKIFNMVVNFLNSKTERNMNKKDILKLFSLYGFKVNDMTEINGLMYFNAQVNKELKNSL
ncbi:MAG: hypothetical protein MUO72_12835 [Bacteroidales bacterium]|nr:hypothetical protein [Bacteroidales bacterium]